MYVSKVNNQPNFGIKCVNKHLWSSKFLESFENSQLVKDINKRYPDASAKYTKVLEETSFCDEPNYHAALIINLAKGKAWKAVMDSYTSSGVDRAMDSFIKATTLSDVEKASAEKVDESILSEMDVVITKKIDNPVIDFLKNLFGIK